VNDLQSEIGRQADQWLGAAGVADGAVYDLQAFVKVVGTFFQSGRWLFRGEGRLYEIPLSPTLYRHETAFSHKRLPGRTLSDQELDEVERCQADYSKGLVADRYIRAFIPLIHRHDVNWLPLARHFGYETRLLDITHNPLVALYFACSDSTADDDAYVYAFSGGNFRPVTDRNPPQTGRSDYPPLPISFLDLYDVDVSLWADELDEMPYFLEPTIPQERLQAQAGGFLFWRRPEPLLHRVRQVIPIRVGGAAKAHLLEDLSAFGIRREVLFPVSGRDA
jgi:hypothetical protein